ncbi:fibropellin-3-like [Gigantopelta aegis]|uniref:fibropellin-3-like n=1 Tax=Gigantopelta aegis TaxID=1735272 RepID=UPI001B88DDC5|nr:fibropellin-3-like [Gigantopelta aegis]
MFSHPGANFLIKSEFIMYLTDNCSDLPLFLINLKVLTCGSPGTIANGQVHGNSYNYGNTVRYSCNTYYNMTGYYRQTCQDNGSWSGVKPRCIFVNTCASNPCKNSGTCVDGLDEYICRCRTGYSGVHCENDIQPPVFTNCPRSFTAHATGHSLNMTWIVPRASDPLGHEVTVITNYPDGCAQLPWDNFTVQYVATKAFNGLQSFQSDQLVRIWTMDN